MRRLAAALADGEVQDDAEFQGFPRSGSGLPLHLTFHASPPALYQRIPAPFLHLSSSAQNLLVEQGAQYADADAAQEDNAADLDGARARSWHRSCG
jgi:hypothetical protein